MTTKCGSWMGPWNGKETLEEKLVKSEQIWSLVNSHVPMSASQEDANVGDE